MASSSPLPTYHTAVIESAEDAFIGKDLNGIIRACNPAAVRLFGYPAAELIGSPVTILIPAHLRDEEVGILARLRRGERVEHFETIRQRKDGSLVEVSLTISPVRDEEGVIIGASKIARDITERNSERRRVEGERLSAAAERERLLDSERAARSEAERANRVKDEFVAMVSHELRTPLNAILGWTQLLSTVSPDAAMLRHGLDVIERNTRLQAQLISDLLDVSRIVSGKVRLDVDHVDLATIIEESIETVQHVASAKRILIRRDFDETARKTIGDAARLKQIVWNLLSNAMKFTPEGGQVDVGLRKVDDRAIITVTDTGIGIPRDFLTTIFDRFQQIGSPATRRHGGLGLGLSIARHFVELHDGRITAWSEGEGKGSTFTVDLPLSNPASLEGDSLGPELRPEGISLRHIRILVVEDEEDTRELLRRILESHDAQVVAVSSAPDALEVLGSWAPDLIVSDIGLPDMSGYDLIKAIREMKGPIATVPAIALTAFARTEDRTRALRAGFQTHLTKPVESAELVVTVASFGELISAGRSPD